MSKRTKALLLRILGLAVCIVPPSLSALEYFPIVKGSAGKSLSTVGIIALVICAIPLWKNIKAFLRSPSAWKFWLVALILCSMCRAVVDEIFVISAIGLPSGLLGALIFAVEKWYRRKHGLILHEGVERHG